MLQNLHTHTVLCDGNNTPEEMIEKAINLGFDSLGFSSHAKTKFNTDWELSCSVGEYIAKINSLKSRYADKIKIYLGAELDYYSGELMPTKELDYTIGSVHMTEIDGRVVDYDHSFEASRTAIDELFEGNPLAYALSYYEKVVKMCEEMVYDIVGHFDLITKFSESHPELIDFESSAYREMAIESLRSVRKRHDFFEVNTGAISRGYRTTPYPAPFILDEMRRLGCKLILTSDCHDTESLTQGFSMAREYVKAHGFDCLYNLTPSGFLGEKI